MFDGLKTIRLIKGKGDGKTSHCWMTALSHFTGGAVDTDCPDDVSPAIARLCVALNDMLPTDVLRTHYCMSRFLNPSGTANDGYDQKRSFLCADYAVRRFAPIALRCAGMESEAVRLEALPEVVDHPSADAAYDAAAHAANAAANAAHAAARAAAQAAARAAAHAAAHAAANAAHTAARAAQAEQFQREIWEALAELVDRCCGLGMPREVVPRKSETELLTVAGTIN